ncbi:hypothetical protein BDY21DRAFT_340613 [Lineolata rhizophorae]|uniref:ABM domain-containing protein n=1 Tax=Lineolata rhizophorae TaxID=578093 RepID=A0A6A6P3J3_9PEZI|nr:hypothetical protein BDY21DRAFT_340613 [Lineolata rhizophorae]
MSSPTTVIAYIPAADDIDRSALTNIFGQVQSYTGLKGIYYAFQEESPSTLDLVTDWEDSRTATQFHVSMVSGSLSDALRPYMDGRVTAYVVNLIPADISIFSTMSARGTMKPITEVFTFYLRPGLGPEGLHKFGEAFSELKAVLQGTKGHRAVTGGFVEGTVSHPSSDTELDAFVALVGWDDDESRTAFVQTRAFGDSIQPFVAFLSNNSVHRVCLVPE